MASRQVKAIRIELHVLADRGVKTENIAENIKEDIELYTENILSVQCIVLDQKDDLMFSDSEAEA